MQDSLTRWRERYSTSIHADHLAGYLKALKIVLAADENLAPRELHALRVGMRYMGVPDNVRQEVEDFDPQESQLLKVLPNFRLGGSEARYLLRDAIELASADGIYSHAERAAVRRMATLLGISPELLRAMESLVDMERATRKLRKALFPQGPISPGYP